MGTRTVCTESIDVVPQEVCTWSYEQVTEDTTAKTVEVTFEKVEKVQMVTVCQPGHHGYGHGGYGGGYRHNYCKEVAQTTAYNVRVVTPVDVPVTVAYPAPIKTCVDKPINLPVVTCADISEERTIQVPSVVDSEVIVAKCLSSPSPNKSVSNLSTDTLMSPHQHPLTQLPLPPMLKQSTLKIALPPNDPVILCRSIAQLKECFQDRNYLSIFILLFMPFKISLTG